MLHPDKPSNLSGPWLTNVAKMITVIYAAITRTDAAILSGKLHTCHALHQFRIFPKVTGGDAKPKRFDTGTAQE